MYRRVPRISKISGVSEAETRGGKKGQGYRSGIDYTPTNNSQDPNSVENSTWHSMRANNENITDEQAMQRGQEFGWNMIFNAGKEAGAAGGIDRLQTNSRGIRALGQGVHALQDAVAHHGVDLAHHDYGADMFPSPQTTEIAEDVTRSAIVVAEIMGGNYTHLQNDVNLNLDGMTSKQFSTLIGAIEKGMKENKVNEVIIRNKPTH